MQRVYATIGRAQGNDVVLDDPTVSNHHARLAWAGTALLVEDLSSENGTFVDGQRVKAAHTRPGSDLRCGGVAVPWSHDGLRKLLKAGTGSRTLLMPQASTPSYVCGACGHVGALGQPPTQKTLTCAKCGATLRTRTQPKPSGLGTVPLMLLTPLLVAAVFGGRWLWLQQPAFGNAPGSLQVDGARADGENLEHVSSQAAKRIAGALTPYDPLTRNTAVKIAARTEGPFHVEQVAEIWNAVRGAWRYVNDPIRQEYFATARETIDNGYVGDCDDFATTLASMVLAIGGKARVVVMDGPGGGHAYAEACVQGEPPKVAAALIKHYKSRWSHYLAGRPVPRTIAFRTSADCPIWLNLDWSSVVPGGAYQAEKWAVAIYEDGERSPLAAASAPDAPNAKTNANAKSSAGQSAASAR
jgi:hypothetical protein